MRVDGTTVANDWSDLTTNGLRATITLTERGMPARTSVQCGAPAQAWAFSDTLLNGTVFEGFSSCSDWTGNGTVNGAVGDPTKTTEAWTRNCVGGGICGVPTSLYCFEQ